jgi:hypothetical protein
VGLAIPVVVIDAVMAVRRGISRDLAVSRILLVAVGCAVAAVLIWLLVNSPWTSLKWTDGLSLRYILPIILLGFFVPLLALFPLTMPWYRAARYRYAGTMLLAVMSVIVFALDQAPAAQDTASHLLAFSAPSTIVAVMVMACCWLATRLAHGRVGGLALAGAAVVVTCAIPAGRLIDARAQLLSAGRAAQLATLSARAPADLTQAQAASAIVSRDAQVRDPRVPLRIFLAARFDEPLELEGPRYDALLYQAHSPELIERLLRGTAPGTGPSDYLVVSTAELRTDHGSAMASYYGQQQRLIDLGSAGPYRIWRILATACTPCQVSAR